jgi:branched-chain amino acid transport system substrate-binding protein
MRSLNRNAVGVASLAAALFVTMPASAKIGSCNDPIVFGTTTSQTGVFSTQAGGWDKLSHVFADEINKRGGIDVKACGKKLPLKFVIYDDQSNAATAVSLFEKMATVDNVDFFVGPDWTSLGLAVPVVNERHKIPMVMANVATPAAYDRGFKYLFGAVYPPVPQWSVRYFDMLTKVNPKPKTFFFVTQDNPVTKAVTAVYTKLAKEKGFEVIAEEVFPTDLKDFNSIVLKMRSARADVIFISSFDNPSVPLVQQMRRQNVKAMDVHHIMITGAMFRQVGKDINGMSGEMVWYPGMKGDYDDLAVAVLKGANIDIFESTFTMSRFAAYITMVQAIEAAGELDRDKVRDALANGRFKTPMGELTFDAKGFPAVRPDAPHANAAFPMQIQDGKPVIVYPPDKATGKLAWPAPTWQ